MSNPLDELQGHNRDAVEAAAKKAAKPSAAPVEEPKQDDSKSSRK